MTLLWAFAAFADPVVLRAPLDAPGVTAGLHDLSAGLPLGRGSLSLAVEASTAGASAGASVGARRTLSGAGRVRQLTGGASVGALLPLVAPGVALSATVWAHGGWVGDRGHFVAGAALPWAAGTGGLRAPLLFELHSGGRVGPVTLGARLSAGPVFTPGADVSVWLEPAVVVQAARRARR